MPLRVISQMNQLLRNEMNCVTRNNVFGYAATSEAAHVVIVKTTAKRMVLDTADS